MVLQEDQIESLPKGHPFIDEGGFVRYEKKVIVNKNSDKYTRIGQSPYNRNQEKNARRTYLKGYKN